MMHMEKAVSVAAKRIMLEWEQEDESVMKVTVFCIFDGTKNVNKGGRSLKKLLLCFSCRSTFLIFPQETNLLHSTSRTGLCWMLSSLYQVVWGVMSGSLDIDVSCSAHFTCH